MKNLIEYGFLGGLFPEEFLKDVENNSLGNIQYAANSLQWNIVNGIEKNIERPLKLFNRMFIGSYPKKYKKPYIKTEYFYHRKNSIDINIGFINIFILRQLMLPFVPNKYLRKWLLTNNNSKKVLFVYSSNFTETILFIKRSFPSVYICLILPDLPQYMNIDKSNNYLYNYLNMRNQKKLMNIIKYVDSFVLLTEQMSDILGIRNNKPFVVIEGMISKNNEIEKNKQLYKNRRIICYTGTLTKKYGIMDLVNAFLLIKDKNYKLIICGKGEMEEEINNISKKDKRIIFMGIVSHKEVLKIQAISTILVNPRQNNGTYTKYSFPSKTLEYMKAGKPIVCFKLDGIPNEYDDYLNYVNNNSIESLMIKMVEIVSLSDEELIKMGNNNRNFVYKFKNIDLQTNKITKMIKDTI